MNNLERFGWTSHHTEYYTQSPYNTLPPGRVTVAHKTCYEVIASTGEFVCELTGRLLFSLQEDEIPCTGDWVIFQTIDDNKGIIVDLFPRQKTLTRKRAGKRSEKQVIASFVDKACIVETFNESLNIRKIERFVAQISGEGISPVIILTKADLQSDSYGITERLLHLSKNIPIFITSSQSSQGISDLKEFIKDGETFVFIGSSGVGKSSLINSLTGDDRLSTSTISSSTGKGRHTSVRREMVILETGGILIDTPGVREFGVTFDTTESESSWFLIDDLNQSCRFSNCSHTSEPGCAVLKAIQDGLLDNETYQNYLKIQLEAARYQESEHQRREKDRKLTRLISNYKNFKKKND